MYSALYLLNNMFLQYLSLDITNSNDE